LVTVCDSVDADIVLMEQRGPATQDDWEAFLRYEGEVPISPGSTFTVAPGVDTFGPNEDRLTPEFQNVHLSFLFSDRIQPYKAIHGDFEVGPEGVPSDSWLIWDGTTTSTPCESFTDSD